MNFITVYDYLLLPIYILIYFYFIRRAAKKYNGTELKRYFIIAFFLRVFGSIANSLLLYYYYETGDSLSFFQGGEIIADMIKNDFSAIENFFVGGQELYHIALDAGYGNDLPAIMGNDPNLLVMKISALVSFVSFGKALIISLFFATLSFIGIWKIYCFLNEISGGKHQKVLAWLVLFLPSIWFFGSGIQKEPLCLLGIGVSIYLFYKNFILKKIRLLEIAIMILMIALLFAVKSYIAIIYLVGLTVVIIYVAIARTQNILLRTVWIITVVVTIIVSITFIDTATLIEHSVELSVEHIQRSKRNYELIHEQVETSKSGFNISEIDPSLESLISHSGEAIVASLFRPFPWESKKIIILFASLEAFLTLLATLYVLIRTKIYGFFVAIFSSPLLLFCFISSILFTLLIGFTTFNFGTIVRYKIVFLPFYLYMLVGINAKYKEKIKGRIKIFSPRK